MSATGASDWVDASALPDEAFLTPEMTSSHVVEVYEERPEKPFDRDTELRITGAQLAERGATNLAEALDLLPDVRIRAAGRGGEQIDIRGSRKGSIKVLIDGVPVSDPYYGTFDIASIPVTDIEQIRISSSSASPIDGTGGPGGVVEVHTRDAVGSRMLRTQFDSSTLPMMLISGTGRLMLAKHWALRTSASGDIGSRDFRLNMPDGANFSLAEDRQQAVGAVRIEFRSGQRRAAFDAWAQSRSFVSPPGEDLSSDIVAIDGETAGRLSVSANDRFGEWTLLGRAYAHGASRKSSFYRDPALSDRLRSEDLKSDREGASILANRPIGRDVQIISSVVFDTENADVTNQDGMSVGGRASIAELASGVQWQHGRYRVDAAAGLAVPMGIGADPWPEAKLAASVAPIEPVTFKVIGGQKGRVPTLRERFDGELGNAALGPEKVVYGELEVTLKPTPWFRAKLSTYARETNGQIRFDPMDFQLVNLGDLSIRGSDFLVSVFEDAPIGGGGSLNLSQADSPLSGADPLDFLPNTRAELWMRGSLGSRAGGNVRLRYIGEQIDRNQTIDDYAIVELSSYARLGEFLGSIRVVNLLDRRYMIRAGVPSAGRTVLFSLRATFE